MRYQISRYFTNERIIGIFINNLWVKSIACDWTGSPSARTTLCDPFSVPFPLLARLLPEREMRVKDIESWQESKETIRAKETRLSCQKEMKTELSVTERRLHGSNSFRFSVQPLSVQRFPSTFLILSPSPAKIFWSHLLLTCTTCDIWNSCKKKKILKKKEKNFRKSHVSDTHGYYVNRNLKGS